MPDRSIRVARWLSVAILTGCLVGAAAFVGRPISAVSGVVWDDAGRPVAGAVVRVKGRTTHTVTDVAGRFTLSGLDGARRVRLTAWRDGFYIRGAGPGLFPSNIVIRLSRHTDRDHAGYRWIAPAMAHSSTTRRLIDWSLTAADRVAPSLVRPVADRFDTGCRDCHERAVDEWSGSAHAQGASNPRFLTMYNGTSVDGRQSPATRYVVDRDYGHIPVKPDPATDHGPGFRLDYAGTAGNCATCHLPGAAVDQPFVTDPNDVTGVSAQGTHCDFCHKTRSVALDPRSGLPAIDRPGVLSMNVVRPAAGRTLVFGPYDDVDGGRDTKTAAMRESSLCAACHQASFWGVPIYESFAEWKASAYAAEGTTCQSCHMKSDGVTTNIAPRRGGIERAADTIATHRFEGALSTSLLQSAARLDVSSVRVRNRLRVSVRVENIGAGHRLPTDSPLREMLLVVDAAESGGTPAALVDGPVLPAWTGDLAQRPGLYFAKVLQQQWTGVTPTAAFWTPTRIVEDTRLLPRASVTATFEFAVPAGSEITASARLLLRRAPYRLMRQKGWDVPDIEMARASVRSSR